MRPAGKAGQRIGQNLFFTSDDGAGFPTGDERRRPLLARLVGTSVGNGSVGAENHAGVDRQDKARRFFDTPDGMHHLRRRY